MEHQEKSLALPSQRELRQAGDRGHREQPVNAARRLDTPLLRVDGLASRGIGMLRSLIKTGIASAAHRAGADRLYAARAGVVNLPLVIGYHRVVEDFRAVAPHSIAPMLVSARTFERQLDWLGRRFQFVTLDDVAAWVEGSKRF